MFPLSPKIDIENEWIWHLRIKTFHLSDTEMDLTVLLIITKLSESVKDSDHFVLILLFGFIC